MTRFKGATAAAILSISLAVQHNLTADQFAHTFAIYPSLSGSMTEAARQLMLED